MVFSSSIFLFFFLPITLLGYYLLKPNYRNMFLLFMSLFFYAWGEPKFVFMMIFSAFINYLCGLGIDYAKANQKIFLKRTVLIFGIVVNLAILFYYKYFDFFINTTNYITGLDLPLKNIVLPIGISFFTFQGMSYMLDIYMGKAELQKNPLNVLLYISLFPQLVAGPIVRYKDINDQINERTCTINKFESGTSRFIIGLAKKMVLANQLGFVADQVFNNPANQNSMASAWVGIICYTLQIYFDFSGYSDMAIGLGRMFGFEFLENFNYPYISKSISEFWRRWHISLSSWFRDYVYIPLGGSRKGNVYFHLMFVFLLTGFWHGASWNFIVWGVWFGVFIVIEKFFRIHNINLKIPTAIKWFYTMLIVVIGWVFFRSPDLSYAIQYLGVMFGLVKPVDVGFTVFWYLNSQVAFLLIVAIIASVNWKDILSKFPKVIKHENFNFYVKRISLVFLLFISIMYVMTATYNPFIYFRF